MSLPQSGRISQPPRQTPHALLQRDATPDEVLSNLPAPRRYSDQCYEVANQIQAFCLARGRDVGLTAPQWRALQTFQEQYDALEARILMNRRIAAVMDQYQAQIIEELTANPLRMLGSPWQRYCHAWDAFGARLEATQAASTALHGRYLDFLRGVLAQLQGEGVR